MEILLDAVNLEYDLGDPKEKDSVGKSSDMDSSRDDYIVRVGDISIYTLDPFR